MTIEGSTSEDEWITHELGGHVHDEEVLIWDEELAMKWPAELRCHACDAVRYISRNEAVSKIANGTLTHPIANRKGVWPVR